MVGQRPPVPEGRARPDDGGTGITTTVETITLVEVADLVTPSLGRSADTGGADGLVETESAVVVAVQGTVRVTVVGVGAQW